MRGVELEVDEDEFQKSVEAPQDVLAVRRLNRLDDEGCWIKSEVIRVCFKGATLPPYIYAYGCRFKVKPYNFPVNQCSRCWKFGHLSRFCPSKKILCPKCGGEHDNCHTTVFKCLNCKGAHMALNKSCPAFLKEKEVRRIMAAEGCLYKKALWLYLQGRKGPAAAADSWIQEELSTSRGVVTTSNTYRDAVLSGADVSKESGCVSQYMGKSSYTQVNQEQAPSYEQEVRKRKKAKRVPILEENSCPVVAQANNVSTEERPRHKSKKRSVGIERLIEKVKSILLSRENWAEKLGLIFKFIAEECLEWFKSFFKEVDFMKLFFSNVNG